MDSDKRVSNVLSMIKDIVVEVINEDKSVFGVPSGHIYAALMRTGITLDTYNQLMAQLVAEGRISGPVNYCYFSIMREKVS